MSEDRGAVDRLNVESKKRLLAEARQRVFDNEPLADVVLFLRARHVPEIEAQEFVDRSRRERLRLIQEYGVRKYRIGAALMLVPTLYNLIATRLNVWNALIFIPLAVVGTVGIWKVANGLALAIKPEKVPGHVYDITR
jgi:hypothetical protein